MSGDTVDEISFIVKPDQELQPFEDSKEAELQRKIEEKEKAREIKAELTGEPVPAPAPVLSPARSPEAPVRMAGMDLNDKIGFALGNLLSVITKGTRIQFTREESEHLTYDLVTVMDVPPERLKDHEKTLCAIDAGLILVKKALENKNNKEKTA